MLIDLMRDAIVKNKQRSLRLREVSTVGYFQVEMAHDESMSHLKRRDTSNRIRSLFPGAMRSITKQLGRLE